MAEEAQQVVWTYAARADLLEALEYLVDKSPDAAAAFLNDVENLAASLAQFPQRGPVVEELEFEDLRQVFVGRHRLVYLVEQGGVAIVRLIHGRRDFRDAWRKRPT